MAPKGISSEKKNALTPSHNRRAIPGGDAHQIKREVCRTAGDLTNAGSGTAVRLDQKRWGLNGAGNISNLKGTS